MNEPKYIDAEAFKRRILSYGTVHEGDRIPIPFYKHYFAEAYVAMLRWVCEEVDDTPAADVVKVVRCKDCKWFDACVNGNVFKILDVEDYCSYGEKKDGQ